jgi:hypothetical protein
MARFDGVPKAGKFSAWTNHSPRHRCWTAIVFLDFVFGRESNRMSAIRQAS